MSVSVAARVQISIWSVVCTAWKGHRS